jgi:hypothetical protein
MKKIIFFLLLTTLFFTNCGLIYTNVKMNATIFNKDVSQDKGIGTKSGTACTQGVLGLVQWGDSSLKAAAEEGKITQVKSMDISQYSILFYVYSKTCVIVNGE